MKTNNKFSKLLIIFILFYSGISCSNSSETSIKNNCYESVIIGAYFNQKRGFNKVLDLNCIEDTASSNLKLAYEVLKFNERIIEELINSSGGVHPEEFRLVDGCLKGLGREIFAKYDVFEFYKKKIFLMKNSNSKNENINTLTNIMEYYIFSKNHFINPKNLDELRSGMICMAFIMIQYKIYVTLLSCDSTS